MQKLMMLVAGALIGNNDLIGMNDLIGVSQEKPVLRDYWSERDRALRTGQNLVVGQGCDVPFGNWISVRTDDRIWPDGWAWGKVVVSKNRGTWLEVTKALDPNEATPERIRAILMPPDPRFEKERAHPSFPNKYDPKVQPRFQEKMDRRQRVYYETPFIAPRYYSSSRNRTAASC